MGVVAGGICHVYSLPLPKFLKVIGSAPLASLPLVMHLRPRPRPQGHLLTKPLRAL